MSSIVTTPSASVQATSFSRERHVAPKFTSGGQQIEDILHLKENETNIIAENIKIPEGWTQTGASSLHRMTKRKLEMQRLKAKHPHSSYDLDGDGAVSVKDYFLAK